MHRIELSSGQSFEVAAGAPILEGAARASVTLVHSCKTGRCGVCKARLVRGFAPLLMPETALSGSQTDDGWILTCVRSAASDLWLDGVEVVSERLPATQVLPCKIAALTRLAADVLQVRLRLPPTARFEHLAGQFVDVVNPRGVRRSYSLACAGKADPWLELHVRAVAGGVMSAYWFESARVGDVLRLCGPQGTFFLRRDTKRHLVFLATGTGMAPIRAMLQQWAEQALWAETVTVFWGGRTRQDLYLNEEAFDSRCRLVPVLSRADASWRGARGHVQDAVLQEKIDLSNAAVYACGSTRMIRSARDSLVQNGLPSQHFHAEHFVSSAHA